MECEKIGKIFSDDPLDYKEVELFNIDTRAMPEDKEYTAFSAYLDDLRLMSSEVSQILKEGSEADVSRAAKHYPGKLNHILLRRNIKSARAIFPFIDVALFQERKPDLRLMDLNIRKDDRELLWDVFRRLESEITEAE